MQTASEPDWPTQREPAGNAVNHPRTLPAAAAAQTLFLSMHGPATGGRFRSARGWRPPHEFAGWMRSNTVPCEATVSVHDVLVVFVVLCVHRSIRA